MKGAVANGFTGLSQVDHVLISAGTSVHVNAVTPGFIDTPLLRHAYSAERDTFTRKRAGILPGRRVGAADEVAQVILMEKHNSWS